MRSFTKKRHILESNLRLEKRFLNEQTEEPLWLSVVNKIGKDKFDKVETNRAYTTLSDKTVITIGNSKTGFGVDIKLPEGKIKSKLTDEMLNFGDGGWASGVEHYNWSSLNQDDIDKVSDILKKYII